MISSSNFEQTRNNKSTIHASHCSAEYAKKSLLWVEGVSLLGTVNLFAEMASVPLHMCCFGLTSKKYFLTGRKYSFLLEEVTCYRISPEVIKN